MNSPVRLLLVDDNELFLAALTNCLAAESQLAVVGHACSTREALAQLELLQVDVVVIDLSMPGLNGLEATRRIKADQRTADIPIVAMSGFDLAVVPGDANLAGAVAFVAKPCFPHEVVQAIREALSTRVDMH